MAILIYLVSHMLLGAASIIGVRFSSAQNTGQRGQPLIFRIFAALAAISPLGLFVWGFFGLTWWAPLLAFLVVALAGGVLAGLTLKGNRPRMIAALYTGIGLVLGGMSVYLAHFGH